ncbi:MAG: Mpo1-like protein [Burkholderiales bacterium]
MRAATDLLSRYAEYHRDQRNIASHVVGVPMIVFALGVLFARPAFELSHVALSPAWVVFALATGWYLTRGSIVLGATVTAGTAALLLVAQQLAYSSVAAWLGWGVSLFVLGWAIQLVGHWYEGRRPAFTDDLVGLLIGPMFIAAEALFMFGWNKPLLAEIERRAGPTTLRDLARIA